MNDPRCPVCGDELDFYGCLGELRGRHVQVERDAARGQYELLRQRAAELVKAWEGAGHAKCAAELRGILQP
jgi:hypothetical protein